MKKIIYLSILSLCIISCASNTPYKSFKKENRTTVDVSFGLPAFLAHLFIPRSDIKEIKEIVSGVRRYHVMVVSNHTKQVEETFHNLVTTSNYEKLFYYREDGTKLDFYTYSVGSKIKEIVLRVKEGNDFVVVNMQGNIKLNKLPSEIEDVIAQLN